jgi:hypothetical protein
LQYEVKDINQPFFFFSVLEFELRAWNLSHALALFALVVFWLGSHAFAQGQPWPLILLSMPSA